MWLSNWTTATIILVLWSTGRAVCLLLWPLPPRVMSLVKDSLALNFESMTLFSETNALIIPECCYFFYWIVTQCFLLYIHYFPNYIISSLRAWLPCFWIFWGPLQSTRHIVCAQKTLLMVCLRANQMMSLAIFNKSKLKLKLHIFWIFKMRLTVLQTVMSSHNQLP